MKKLLVAALFIIAGIFGFKQWDKARTIRAATLRVEGIVHAMADKDEQTAIGLWAENREKLDFTGLQVYSGRFASFWSGSGLAASSGWMVTSTEWVGSSSDVLITVRSGDTRIVFLVKPKSPISVASGG